MKVYLSVGNKGGVGKTTVCELLKLIMEDIKGQRCRMAYAETPARAAQWIRACKDDGDVTMVMDTDARFDFDEAGQQAVVDACREVGAELYVIFSISDISNNRYPAIMDDHLFFTYLPIFNHLTEPSINVNGRDFPVFEFRFDRKFFEKRLENPIYARLTKSFIVEFMKFLKIT